MTKISERAGSSVFGSFWLSSLMLLSILAASEAGAVSARVKFACARDYYAHCSQYPSDSAQARRCMDAVGEKLSPRCVNALVAEGEVSQKEVNQRAANLRD